MKLIISGDRIIRTRMWLLFLVFSVTTTNANVEGDALYALTRAVKDPGNVLQSWDPTLVNPCTWFHVTCDKDGRVTRLDLGNANLSGNLVPELGKLEHLQYLNKLEGSIPKELGDGLKNLVSLDLYQNNLTCSIPATLSKLSHLRFFCCQVFSVLKYSTYKLTGRIPRDLTKLGNLKSLDVSNNDLCGTIPTTGSFTKLSEKSFLGYLKNNLAQLFGPNSLDTTIYYFRDQLFVL
ncbi:hypothetical protein MKW94_008764 [Papaver nudicaule]|uniref:Leucine-rich repeat-containing N-terminal plant-type domain-containing protein n=1 Tax=Papaver nudicaule TaxID=74823 RepID=A0AA41VQI3_PAPNU|nr:hypothetical protein [Papaver nudicaule]